LQRRIREASTKKQKAKDKADFATGTGLKRNTSSLNELNSTWREGGGTKGGREEGKKKERDKARKAAEEMLTLQHQAMHMLESYHMSQVVKTPSSYLFFPQNLQENQFHISQLYF